MGKRVVGFVQVRDVIACHVGVAGTSQDQSFEGYAIEGSPRDAMTAILVKSRENEFSGLRKSWGVSASSSYVRQRIREVHPFRNVVLCRLRTTLKEEPGWCPQASH